MPLVKIMILFFGMMILFYKSDLNDTRDMTCCLSPGCAGESTDLYERIVFMDSVWEDSFNNCKPEIQEKIISEDLEFYHDKSGLMTSKKQLIDALKKNICGKVTRELKPGSIEVYSIPGYGAVEMGYHRFHSKHDDSIAHFSKFVHIWHNELGYWRIARVISLH
jgi:hypothetical protein